MNARLNAMAILVLGFTVGIALPWGLAQAQQTDPPPAERVLLGDLIERINSGDASRLESFIRENFAGPDPAAVATGLMRMREETGGLRIRETLDGPPARVRGLFVPVRDRAWKDVTMFFAAAEPDYLVPVQPLQVLGVRILDVAAPPEHLAGSRLDDARVRRNIDAYLREVVAETGFSGAVVVARDGEIVAANAYGYADCGHTRDNAVDTRFNLASITKLFTAVATVQLIEQGRLRFESTVGEVLQDYPNAEVASGVNVADLLSHRSGLLGSRMQVEQFPAAQETQSVADWMAPWVGEPLMVRPDQQFEYSNAGFILLGAIVERISGMPFHAYVEQNIFAKAGMTGAGFPDAIEGGASLAAGCMDADGGARVDNRPVLTRRGGPHGGAFGTAEDLIRFQRALAGGALVSPQSLARMWRGTHEEADTGRMYGLGTEMQRYGDRLIVGHGGGWPGVTNHFEFDSAGGYAIVVLSNVDIEPGPIAYKIREWLLQGDVSPIPSEMGDVDLAVRVRAPESASVGQRVTIDVEVENLGSTLHAAVIDFEVMDAAGGKAHQQFVLDQPLPAGSTRIHHFDWRPNQAGAFGLTAGVFGNGWRPKLEFMDEAKPISIVAP